MRTDKLLIAVVLCLLPLCGYAQRNDPETPFISYTSTEPPIITRQPLLDEDASTDKLFNLPEKQRVYYMRADLPDDNFMTIEFEKLSDWPGKDALGEMIGIATQSMRKLHDSLNKNPLAGYKLELHVPKDNSPVIMALHTSANEARYMMLKDDVIENVKIKMDTVTILKVFDNQSYTAAAHKVLYTFIMKNMEDLINLKGDPYIITQADDHFDSLVQQKRAQWHQQDGWYHTFIAEYNENDTTGKKMKVYAPPALFKRVGIEANLGVSYITDELAPYIDYGISYRWLNTAKKITFARLFASDLVTYNKDNIQRPENGLWFMNVEMGNLYQKSGSWFSLYKTSVGLGYKIASDMPDNSLNYRLFFNYSLTRIIRLGIDYYVSGKKAYRSSNDTRGGLTLTYSLY